MLRLRQAGACTLVAAVVAFCGAGTKAQECCDPDSPFREGEGWAEVPATCETIAHWADRAPQTDDRITMAMQGRLSEVHTDGALAYLIVCDEPGVQVMCVTYQTNGMAPGDTVLVAGGYGRTGPEQVILDPCLATAE
jgi:hypothetical protein